MNVETTYQNADTVRNNIIKKIMNKVEFDGYILENDIRKILYEELDNVDIYDCFDCITNIQDYLEEQEVLIVEDTAHLFYYIQQYIHTPYGNKLLNSAIQKLLASKKIERMCEYYYNKCYSKFDKYTTKEEIKGEILLICSQQASNYIARVAPEKSMESFVHYLSIWSNIIRRALDSNITSAISKPGHILEWFRRIKAKFTRDLKKQNKYHEYTEEQINHAVLDFMAKQASKSNPENYKKKYILFRSLLFEDEIGDENEIDYVYKPNKDDKNKAT